MKVVKKIQFCKNTQKKTLKTKDYNEENSRET